MRHLSKDHPLKALQRGAAIKAIFSTLVPGAMLFALVLMGLALLAFGCTEARNSPHTGLDMRDSAFSYVGKVFKVGQMESQEQANRARWRVEVEIISVMGNAPKNAPASGSQVVLFVHSVVKTFRVDASSIVGRNFDIVYQGGFQNPYPGMTEVSVHKGVLDKEGVPDKAVKP